VDELNEAMTRFISEFWGIDRNSVTDDFRFGNETIVNFSSVRFYRFIAAFEDRFGVSVKNVEKIVNVRALEENIS
jgi:acyl carrier protein